MTRAIPVHDLADRSRWDHAVEVAARFAKRGRLVVLPIDSAYGIATDAFQPKGVAALMAAKGRERGAPVPIMVGRIEAAQGVALVPRMAQELMEAFWPGPLTIVAAPRASLAWDVGGDRPHAPISLRMPLHPAALVMLRTVGPTAVLAVTEESGAPVTSGARAQEVLGEKVDLYLQGGDLPDLGTSTVVDVTGTTPVMVREGALTWERIVAVCPQAQRSPHLD